MDYIAALTAVNRYAAGSTSLAERSVLFFVLERTLRFNKVSETIPYRHFIDGIYDRSKGEVIVTGVGLSRKTVVEAVKALKKRGIIGVSVGKNNANVITLLLTNLEKFIKMAKLKTSKKFKGLVGGVKSTLGGCKRSTTNYHTIKPSQTISSPSSLRSEERVDAAPAETAAEAASRVRQEYKRSRDQKIRSLFTERPSQPNLIKAYRSAYLKHHDGDPDYHLTRKEWGNYKHFVTATEFPDWFDYPTFFEETIQYWPNLMRGDFRWCKGSPPLPTLAFICKLIRRLYEYYVNEHRSGDLYVLSRKYVEDGVHKDLYADVCKSRDDLQTRLKKAEDRAPDQRVVAQAQTIIRQRHEVVGKEERMRKAMNKLQLENARLRSANCDAGEECELPNFDKVTLAQEGSSNPRRRKRTVPVAS